MGDWSETTQRADDLAAELEHVREERLRLQQSLEEALAKLARAEAADRAKDEFIATISHELRTPLNTMRGWAQMLAGEDLDEPMRSRAVQAIERSTRLQSQLIDDLLDVSRIVSGKLRVEKKPLNLIPLVASSVEVFRKQAEAQKLGLFLEISAPFPDLISGDAKRVHQIVGNLLGNAIKFTPPGGKIAVLVDEVRGNGRRRLIRIRVLDTGQGIERELLPHVFERFTQGETGTRRTNRGLGLGLAIARHLAELHDGTVTAESEGQGRGATFTIELPAIDLEARASFPTPPAGLRRDGAEVRSMLLAGISVLVVDDEPDSRELMATMLSQLGASVTRAASAIEAFEKLGEIRPDVLVSDVAMPSEDGYQLMRRIRALPSELGGETPALAVTAYAATRDRDRALEAGFERHVAKPIEAQDFIAAVAKLARRGRY